MISYQNKDFTIEVVDHSTYKFGSTDNNFNYAKVYFGNGGQNHLTSKHGIKLFRNDQIIDSCIVIGSGGATGVYQSSLIFDNDQLVICCCDSVFCLSIPDIELKWKTKVDQATCFQIFKQQENYIVHGEMAIAKLDRAGNIIWEFGVQTFLFQSITRKNLRLIMKGFYLLILEI